MELELIKYQLAKQFNQHDSAIKNIMLNSGYKPQQFNDKKDFSLRKHNLGVSIKTIDDGKGIFHLYFKDLMDLEKELGYPILIDLENYSSSYENRVSKEVVTLEGTNLVFKLEHFLLTMHDFDFSKKDLEIIDEEIVFDLKAKHFKNADQIESILNSWDNFRMYSYSEYTDMYPTNQLIDAVVDLVNNSVIDEQVGSWVKSVFMNRKPKKNKSSGASFIKELMDLSMQSNSFEK